MRIYRRPALLVGCLAATTAPLLCSAFVVPAARCGGSTAVAAAAVRVTGFLPVALSSSSFSSAALDSSSGSSGGSSIRPGVSRARRGGTVLRAHAVAKGRPSLDDVERLSRGEAAKKRGTGSRAVCHRLNEMERKEFELAKKTGFVQLRGTGYRRERKGSPLANIHRQLCDAMGRACIEIHRGLGADATDEVVVDVSPFRADGPGQLDEALAVLRGLEQELLAPAAAEGEGAADGEMLARWEMVRDAFDADAWATKPIWELPVISYVFDCTGDRSLAKRLAQEAHARLGKLPRRR